ncbi:hypothetical protein FBEOM_12090 [Fusarium beomiforme]|uniref:Uncharacterized protein n=1 Tax=Fusarium beomiforme TaxID=44412 RepID=A0A9P5DTD3_9HYPO|nr:hypothetical protein FBEOM_12090 [Fusarium beomiforme]
MLEDSHIDAGEWPLRQPTNVIEAGTEEVVYLKSSPLADAKARVKYEVQLNENLESFVLEFHCPSMLFSRNYLHVASCSSGISVDVRDFNRGSSPLRGNIDFQVKLVPGNKERVLHEKPYLGVRGLPPVDKHRLGTYSHRDLMRINYDFGFKVPFLPVQLDKRPIHESIAIAAFIQSKIPFPKGTFYNNINDKQWEYFRGIIWNDDPSCLLFINDTEDNRHFGLGIDWSKAYVEFGDRRNMTARSHRDDLQFLHAMGRFDGDTAQDTHSRIMHWMKVMYKLACGNQDVSADDPLRCHFPEYFDSQSTPTRDATLRDLLLAETPGYLRVNLQARALGSCLHIISDSFSLGHTQRRLKNPHDLIDRDSESYIQFRPGAYGDWGPILCFHNFSKQKFFRHQHYDTRKQSQDPIPKYTETFNDIIGARNAIDASMKLINLFADKAAWEPHVTTLLNEIFELDRDVKPSNHFVDEEIISFVYQDRPQSGLFSFHNLR